MEQAEKGSGAGDGNRTHVASLEDWNSTIELRPQRGHIIMSALALSIRVRVLSSANEFCVAGEWPDY